MKKLFGHNKQKTAKGLAVAPEEHNVSTPIHHLHSVYGHQQNQQPPMHGQPHGLRRTPSEEERWEVVSAYEEAQLRSQYQSVSSPSRTSSFTSLPPGASPPISSPNAPRSPSPFSASAKSSTQTNKVNHTRDRDPQQLQQLQAPIRKQASSNTPVAVGILKALDPPRTDIPSYQPRFHSEEQFTSYSENGHYNRERDREKDATEKKEKKGFWNRDKDKDKERERLERDREKGKQDENHAELTRMIGYLTATAAEDWSVVLEVCERASASDSNAKEAVRALRREFKYGEPPAQLSAARLWAIMLRNSSEPFISQSTSRKFLDTLEDLLTSSRTSPVVRERVLDVIAAAAYASGSKKDTGFRGLWRRVKPIDKPDEGMPFDNDDAMFNPPISGRLSHYDVPQVSFQEPSPLPADQKQSHDPPRKRKSPSRNRIIPPEEDIRRLFQECKIGQGNAALLSQALALSKPQDLKRKDIIKEFYVKCRASQELIFAQIPWASAGAEKSRALRDQECIAKTGRTEAGIDGLQGDEPPVELTTEEQLLADLLAANADLIEALQQYDDLERVAMERKAEDRSRKETRMDRRQLQQLEQETTLPPDAYVGGGSPSSSPSSTHSPIQPATHPQHLNPHSTLDLNSLAPPPAAPHGPRSPAPASTHSRTPSPGTPILDAYTGGSSGVGGHDILNRRTSVRLRNDSLNTYEDNSETAIKPSAKALGKRRVVEAEHTEESFDPDDIYFDDKDASFPIDDQPESEPDDDKGEWKTPPVRYVYDAAAERTQQRIREGTLVVNGIH